MRSFIQLSDEFQQKFEQSHFPSQPVNLYDACNYFLALGGKRIRPVCCLMGNELFDNLHPDAWQVSIAIELFHNFTLIHDDIMDAAKLRRGKATVHEKFGPSTALLSGDVMLVAAYDYLNKIDLKYQRQIIHLFNKTAREVCEGQQMDMDYEKQRLVTINDYLHMIELKTSVLLAASMQMGAILGGASEGNCQHLYEVGRNIGIAFQVQDDYLDAFGSPDKFGKAAGGDIRQNKKTFLLIRTLDIASDADRELLTELQHSQQPDKVDQVLRLYKKYGVDEWALTLKEKYYQAALKRIEDIAVTSSRKKELLHLTKFLIEREH
jgi:geranylgeranyl diphosphate synthase type II